MAREEATRCLRLGRAVRSLPHAEEAWLAGDITGRHVALLAAKRSDRTAAAMAADEPKLIGFARSLTFRSFSRAMAYWEQVVDPVGVEVDADRLHEERRAHLSQTWLGSWRLDAELDPIGGSIVADALRAVEQELFETDWAEAKARVGAGRDRRRPAAHAGPTSCRRPRRADDPRHVHVWRPSPEAAVHRARRLRDAARPGSARWPTARSSRPARWCRG
jgi:hypothetical protein